MSTAVNNNNLHNQLLAPKESDLVLHKTPGTQGDGGTFNSDFPLVVSSSQRYFHSLLNRCHMHQFEILIPQETHIGRSRFRAEQRTHREIDVAPSLGNRAHRAGEVKEHILELKKTIGQKERDENKWRRIQDMNERTSQINLCATPKRLQFLKNKAHGQNISHMGIKKSMKKFTHHIRKE